MTISKRIGIVGLGRMGERIARAAQGLGHEVAAVYDAADAPYAFGPSPHLAALRVASMAEFWAAGVDLMAIATYGPTHCAYLREGLEHGIRRFLVEKPLATSLTEARATAELATAAGARVVVNHGRRYCAVYDRLKQWDGSPEMGPLASAVLTMGAGGLGCMGIHFFDLFNRVFGRAETVYATLTQTRGRNPRGDEFNDPGGTVLIGYGGGRRAIVDMGDDVGVPGRMDFIYERGRVEIAAELSPWRILRRPLETRALPATRYGMPLEEVAFDGFTPCEIIYATSGAVADALADGETASGIDTGLASMEIYAALRWSAKTGGPVSLPLPAEAENAAYAIT